MDRNTNMIVTKYVEDIHCTLQMLHNIVSCLAYSLTLKMVATDSYETSVNNCWSTRHHIRVANAYKLCKFCEALSKEHV
jgi:hypothetical protein